MAQLKDTVINGNLHVNEDLHVNGAVTSDNEASFTAVSAGAKTSVSDGKTGIFLSGNGNMCVHAATYPYFNFGTGTDTSASGGFAYSVGVKTLLAWSNTDIAFQNSTGKQLQFKTDCFRPNANNVFYLGDSTYKWKAVYANTGTIQTSDRNKKENIEVLDERYENFFNQLQPVSYEFKGNEHDRVHIGFVAQDVEESLNNSDLTAMDFAGFCKDLRVAQASDGSDYEVLDKDGNKIYDYSLRYDEFIALNTHMIKKANEKIAAQQDEIDDLKEIIKSLKQDIDSLKK